MSTPVLTVTSPFTQAYFEDLAAVLDRSLRAGEFYTACLSAETSDFVRLNHGKVRQPGSVSQCYLDIDLIAGQRHATQRLAITGMLGHDSDTLAHLLRELRDVLPGMSEDPHLLYSTTLASSTTVRDAPLPPAEIIVDEVLEAGRGHDLVGIYAGGPVMRGFANALGQRNWHESTCFGLQWSLYHRADKAVKTAISGFTWEPSVLGERMREAQAQLSMIALPARALAPGDYRVFLAPAAMEEIAGMLQWGGFSARALATQQSSLARMRGPDGLRLDSRVTMREDTGNGVAPAFQSAGFMRPASVSLIEEGRLVGALASPRSAREFGIEGNGANVEEMPESLAIAGGDLAAAEALAVLDRGLYVGNLWYLNYSDRPACRITGMTRFATFWVEGGRIVAPVDVLRFDDTLFRMFGDHLEALTRETELRLDANTYMQRSLSSTRVPGALLSKMTFTL
ncbi:MAG: metallopeptidase TldD-related protein [Pseudomonadota bacterium]|nr:metallopeptidase TldD-related protein [Pseudomonadota bacterium]